MKFRGLLVAVVVLAGLGGFLYWSQHHQPAAKLDDSPLPPILKVDARSVSSLTVRDKGAPAIVLTPVNSTEWQITAPINFRADTSATNHLLAALAELVPQRVVQDKPENLDRYGLADPAVTVDVAEKNSQSARLLLGDHTPTSDGVYAMIAGNPHIYTVQSWLLTTFDKKADDLRDQHLLPVKPADIRNLDIARKGEEIDIARTPGGWQIQKPGNYRADFHEIDGLVQQITSATWDGATTETQAAAAFAHGTPVATVRVTTGSGATAHTDTLTVRKSGDNDYATSSAITGTWKVDSSLAAALDRDVESYRNKQLLDFGYSNPLNIEYHDSSTTLKLVRSNNDWFSDGKKMDAASVEALVSALRDLAASKFVESGYTKPDVDVTVVSSDGHPIEKVHFQKTADGAIGKRDDGPDLFSLDTTTMNNLYAAAAGVKPAAASAKRK